VLLSGYRFGLEVELFFRSFSTTTLVLFCLLVVQYLAFNCIVSWIVLKFIRNNSLFYKLMNDIENQIISSH
jgi:hypothetical protein